MSGDIEPAGYLADTLRIDATDIPFDDESFDVVISSHVLDAIPDDLRAISEIYRILKTGGWTLVAIPIYGEQTFEAEVSDEGESKRLYGTPHKARLNGLDVRDKLADAGFAVEIFTIDDVSGNYVDRDVESPHIDSDRYLFLCHKGLPGGQAGPAALGK